MVFMCVFGRKPKFARKQISFVFYNSLVLKSEAQHGQTLLLLPLCNKPLKSQSYYFVNVYLSVSINLTAIIGVILTP